MIYENVHAVVSIILIFYVDAAGSRGFTLGELNSLFPLYPKP